MYGSPACYLVPICFFVQYYRPENRDLLIRKWQKRLEKNWKEKIPTKKVENIHRLLFFFFLSTILFFFLLLHFSIKKGGVLSKTLYCIGWCNPRLFFLSFFLSFFLLIISFLFFSLFFLSEFFLSKVFAGILSNELIGLWLEADGVKINNFLCIHWILQNKSLGLRTKFLFIQDNNPLHNTHARVNYWTKMGS